MTASQVEVMPNGLYKKREMLTLLSRTLKRRCSPDTFKQWKQDFGIEADPHHHYWQDDLDYLRAWIRFYRKWGRTRTKADFRGEYAVKEAARKAEQELQAVKQAAVEQVREAERPVFIEVEKEEINDAT